MSGIFGSPKLPPPPPPPTLPPLAEPPSRGNDPRIADAARKDRLRRSRAKGRSSTILGGSSGLKSSKKTLLGE